MCETYKRIICNNDAYGDRIVTQIMNIYMASFQQVGMLFRKARKRAFLTLISYNIRHGLVLHFIYNGRHLLYQRN